MQSKRTSRSQVAGAVRVFVVGHRGAAATEAGLRQGSPERILLRVVVAAARVVHTHRPLRLHRLIVRHPAEVDDPRVVVVDGHQVAVVEAGREVVAAEVDSTVVHI